MKQFSEILCVVDLDVAQDPVVSRAVHLAENTQAKLTIVGVLQDIRADIQKSRRGTAETEIAMAEVCDIKLQTIVEPYRRRVKIDCKLLTGTGFLATIREVLRIDADLVIKTADGLDWLERLFGSDDMHLLRKCPCPVLLVKPGVPESYRCILAAVDVEDAYPAQELATRQALNHKVMDMAMFWALPDLAQLHVVHAWTAICESAMRGAFLHEPEDRIQAYIEHEQHRYEANLSALMRETAVAVGQATMDYLKPLAYLVKGPARKEIPALATQIGADLVVMGTVARTGIPGLLIGNTAESILGQLNCSVLAIKPPGFQTPVTL